MADGARFPAPTFQPHNQYIPASFSPENPTLLTKFPGTTPNNLFSPQLNSTSVNSVREHVTQMFPGRDVMFDSTQRFHSQFHQNHSNMQQNKPPMVVPFPHVQRQPFSAGHLANTDKQYTNSISFPAPGQLQFLPSNSQTNMHSNIPQMSNSSSPFPAAPPQLSKNDFTRATSYVSMGHEQPRPFPAPFSGPISVPPPPTPMQFPPMLPGNIATPVVHLAGPPVIQPQHNSGPRTQEMTNQEWIHNFLKERGIEKQGKQTEASSHLKVHTYVITNYYFSILG